jgi:hypothetical protein
MGLRNSFDFTFDPLTPANEQGFYRIFATENGPGCDDEMNRIEAGGNYGWRPDYPCDDSDTPDPYYNSILPLWHTIGDECCVAPTGIEVYTGDRIPDWRNHLFMATYNLGGLLHFTLSADRTTVTSARIVDGVKANTDLLTGPDGAFYYIEGGGWGEGTLKRIIRAPEPAATRTPLPLPVELPGEGSVQFEETGHTVSGIFLEYWTRHGELMQQGFPISELLAEKSRLDGGVYTVQYFERAILEYHPDLAPPFNVLLTQLGTFRYRKKYPDGAPGQSPNASDGSVLFEPTGKRVGGKFLEYWQAHGGLVQNGYPISEEFEEVSELDGKPYRVQYFERAVFEYHPELQPPYDVLLSQLGTFRFHSKYGAR